MQVVESARALREIGVLTSGCPDLRAADEVLPLEEPVRDDLDRMGGFHRTSKQYLTGDQVTLALVCRMARRADARSFATVTGQRRP